MAAICVRGMESDVMTHEDGNGGGIGKEMWQNYLLTGVTSHFATCDILWPEMGLWKVFP